MTDHQTTFGRLLLLGCVAMGLGACAGSAVPDHGISVVQFDDIPVPRGLDLEEMRGSHSYQVGRFRFGDFEYSGHTPMEQAVAYMRERMPHHGWQLSRTEGAVESDCQLTFWRQPYEAACRVWQSQGLTRMRVELRTISSSGGDTASAE